MIEHESTQVGALPGELSYTGSGLHGQRTPDAADRLDTIAWSIANQTVSSTDYELDVMGRRSKATRDDGTHWDYGYNTKGEVTSAVQKTDDNAALPGRDFGYNYDGMGNRTSATVANVYPPPPLSETNYTANNLNQYTGIEHPSPLRKVLQGLAHENAAIEVRSYNSPAEAPAFNATSAALAARPASLPVARIAPNGQGFITEAPAANNSGPTWRYLTIDAARPGVGMNGRTVKTQRTGWLYYPPANETLVYDLDGNLTEDARWTYTWDAENRLTQMTEKDDGSAAAGTRPALQRLSFTYDSQSRRIRKVAELRRNSNWEVTSDTRFLYDDWNLVGEFVMNLQSGIMNLKSSYAWGLDLSGTQQGAGGVGGLLLVRQHLSPTLSLLPSPFSLAPTYDGNGNITAYVELASGSVTQRLEYDAFGNELSLDSSLVQTSSFSLQTSGAPAFGFSSKYTDHESGLCYYGFRYYSAELGRWISRDPIEEKGGFNLYGMCENDAVNRSDVLGLSDEGLQNVEHCCVCNLRNLVIGKQIDRVRQLIEQRVHFEGAIPMVINPHFPHLAPRPASEFIINTMVNIAFAKGLSKGQSTIGFSLIANIICDRSLKFVVKFDPVLGPRTAHTDRPGNGDRSQTTTTFGKEPHPSTVAHELGHVTVELLDPWNKFSVENIVDMELGITPFKDTPYDRPGVRPDTQNLDRGGSFWPDSGILQGSREHISADEWYRRQLNESKKLGEFRRNWGGLTCPQ